MGFVSTITRRMRNNRLSKRLSTASTKPHDEDSNDLIKTISETASVTRGASIESTSTIVHHSFHNPVLPSEPPANRMQVRTDNENMRTLFDGSEAIPRLQTDRAPRAPSRREYPVLRLDTSYSSLEMPKLDFPMPLEIAEMEKEMWRNESREKSKRGDGYGKGGSDCSSTTTIEKGLASPAKSVNGKRRNRMSVAVLFKKHCGLNIPRSSISLKKGGSQASPKWLDSSGSGGGAEGEGLVEMKNEKWLKAHLQTDEKRRNSLWGGGLGRSW